MDTRLPPLHAPAANDNEAIVTLRAVSLWRRTQEEFSYDLKRLVFSLLQRRYRRPQRRRVLHDISLEIRRGEKIGIIGANGSGKSTLLKVIAGILQPTGGAVNVGGAIAPLIEIGAGFDLELSVRDNIVYYGVLLGRKRVEMLKRVEAILGFAELTDHANEPLKALSSGMSARLGFAIATDVRPEILILDEVLSVGDEAFRRKSGERIARFWDAHSTIIVVSHDPGFIEAQCQRAIFLEEGKLVAFGLAQDVVRLYADRLAQARLILDLELLERLEGRVVRGDASMLDEERLFLIRDGKKVWIERPEWLEAAGVRWPDDVTFLPPGSVQRIPDGGAL